MSPRRGLWPVVLGFVALAAVAADDPDPLAAARSEGLIGNVEAGIPPQCYTRTGDSSNPCWACHTTANGRNRADDWERQSHYAFDDLARTNHWTNLFKDRRPAIARIDDAAILAWVRRDNAGSLGAVLQRHPEYTGWRPDLDFSRGLDADGFARDGSGWRAFRYKPFVGTFWPTNGSVDETYIRLPAVFRQAADGQVSLVVYRANLAILEAAVSASDGDLPAHYSGGAASVAVVRDEYPPGTEFLHAVRYLDPDAPDFRAVRFKELRHSEKRFALDDVTRERRHDDEVREQLIGERPHYAGTALTSQTNALGWRFQGFIEDASGELRLQTREEQLYCMGCHTGLGVTVDGSFSLPRKVPGGAGWGMQTLAGIRDVPQEGSDEPEYVRYFRRVGAGDEFRANAEMLRRFFVRGIFSPAALRRAGRDGHGDLRDLVVPSRERALLLDKAYRVIVDEQSYVFGRDAVVAPLANVHRSIEPTDPPPVAARHVYKDGRLKLQWEAARAP